MRRLTDGRARALPWRCGGAMRLSHDIREMHERYDVVVVGSGYGAAVLAARLQERASRGGEDGAPRVCVLERGREVEPGSFPNDPRAITADSQLTILGEHSGSRLGLFDYHVHRDLDVLVGCGLGGTSLINGGISIEPDSRVFDEPCWPDEIVADR